MWIQSGDQLLAIPPAHVSLSTVLKAYAQTTPIQAMENYFGSEHLGFPQLVHDLAYHRGYDWLEWRNHSTQTEPPLSLEESLQYDSAIKTLCRHFDTIFKPCILQLPNVHDTIITNLVKMLHDILDPTNDMYDNLIKTMKLEGWKESLSPQVHQFMTTYSSIPLGTLVQIIAQASILDLRHVVCILLILFVDHVNMFDTEKMFAMFAIPPANNASATQALHDILTRSQAIIKTP
jgi:hypothetical protein